MSSTPRHPYRPRASPYGPRGGFRPSHVPPQPYSTPVRHQHYSPTPNFSTPPPPWGGGLGAMPPPPPPPGQFFTPSPHHLLPSPLSTSSTPLTPQRTPSTTPGQNYYSPSPGSFYMDPDMPSPMIPPQTKRKRFAPIRGRDGRGRSGGRHHRNRPFRGGRGGRGRGGTGADIDAYYDDSMLEDPWRYLLSAERSEEVGQETMVSAPVSVEQDREASSNIQEHDDSKNVENEGKDCGEDTQPDSSSPLQSHEEILTT